MIRLLIILISIFSLSVVKGQNKSVSRQNTDRLAERIIPTDDADLNYEDLYENMSQLASHPLNLNRASRDELLAMGFLSQTQADNLISYRNENSDFLEIYELQSIPGFDNETIDNILPYVSIGPSPSAKNFMGRIRAQQSSYFLIRVERTIEQSRGYNSETDSTSKYRGDPHRIYSRFRMTSPGDISIGITAEKDAGEQFKWDKGQRGVDAGFGFDFYSAHLQLMNKGALVNLVAGDYVAQFGQGLTLGGGFGAGKGSETITTLRRTSTGFMPYTSANESGFFRGVAATARLPGSLMLHTFISSLPRDASPAEENSLAVLQSGKHRTTNELNGRHQLTEQNVGAGLEYKGSSFEAGVIVHRTMYRRPVNKSPSVYNAFDFNGSGNTNAGAFGGYTIGSFSVFGEFAQTIEHGQAWVAGILGSISRTIDISVLARRYDRNYYTFYSNAISENTAPANEHGLYWGWKHAINRRLSYTAYTDLFTFPWLKFRNYVPSAGSESLVRVTYRLSRSAEFYFQFRDERKNRNVPLESPVYKSLPGRRQNWILSSSLKLGQLSLRTKIQFSSYRQQSITRGVAMALDAAYDWSKVSIDTRIAIFDSDDFDNRQYMNERDVLMAFSFPAYYGEGTRAYVVGRFQPSKWIDLSLKLSRTSYFNSVSSGSGGDTIEGNTRQDVKLQVIFRLN
jgi:hypothetical protein